MLAVGLNVILYKKAFGLYQNIELLNIYSFTSKLIFLSPYIVGRGVLIVYPALFRCSCKPVMNPCCDTSVEAKWKVHLPDSSTGTNALNAFILMHHMDLK